MHTLTVACLAALQLAQVPSEPAAQPAASLSDYDGLGRASLDDSSPVAPTVFPDRTQAVAAEEAFSPYTSAPAGGSIGDTEPQYRDPSVRQASGTQPSRGGSFQYSQPPQQAAPVTPLDDYNQGTTAQATTTQGVAARSLIAICTIGLSELAEEERTRGELVTLQELLTSSDRGLGQTQTVSRYWDLAIATGEYRFAIDEERYLQEVQATTVGSSSLVAELASARARTKKARLNLLERQERLKEVSSRFSADVLPWPADTPLVGAYRTRFETLFAGQPRPRRLQQIDRALPLLLEHLELQAAAVAAAESAVDDERRGVGGQANLRALLESHRRLRDERRDFLAAVEKYNRQIAEYALSVAGPSLPADRLVGTLIKTRDNMVRVGNRSARTHSGAR